MMVVRDQDVFGAGLNGNASQADTNASRLFPRHVSAQPVRVMAFVQSTLSVSGLLCSIYFDSVGQSASFQDFLQGV